MINKIPPYAFTDDDGILVSPVKDSMLVSLGASAVVHLSNPDTIDELPVCGAYGWRQVIVVEWSAAHRRPICMACRKVIEARQKNNDPRG